MTSCNRYDPTNAELLAQAQAGDWFSRDTLILDEAIQGEARQLAWDEYEAYLRGDWQTMERIRRESE